MRKQTKKTIVFTGGGSGGPVSPLIALGETLQKHRVKAQLIFIGTKTGIEGHMVKQAGFPFVSITAAKLQRYWSWQNLVAPFKLIRGFFQAYRILNALNPEYVLGAGGFVQVPVCWAAWLLGIPVFIHQQDVLPSLSNKLCAPIARRVTVTFEESVADFPHGWLVGHLHAGDRVLWTGNPVRNLKLPTQEKAISHFHLRHDYPTLLVMGGGTGALSLNALILEALPELVKVFNIIHITGKGKKLAVSGVSGYKAFEFIDEMEYAYAASDVVMCRAGLSTITELAAVKKPVVLVPLPGTHQELNAFYLSEQGAAIAIDQDLLYPGNLITLLRSLLLDGRAQRDLAKRLHAVMPEDANENVLAVIAEALESK